MIITRNLKFTLAYTHVDLPSGGMLEVDPYVTSTWNVQIERGNRSVGHWVAFSVTQPPRAETGQGQLTYLSGLHGGEPEYSHASVSLVPNARETQVKAVYGYQITPSSRVVVDVAYAHNFLHRKGLNNINLGLVYRFAM